MNREPAALITLSPAEARTAAAIFERLFPADENGPGAKEIGALTYLDHALTGAYRDQIEAYRLGLAALDRAARRRYGTQFADCDLEEQDAMISALEQGTLPDLLTPAPQSFFKMLLDHLQEGLFSDPAYGGNRDKLGWRFLGHPALTSVPEALATGSLDLKTNCRIVRIVTDGEGHANGVEYIDAAGDMRVQEARTVILKGEER